MKSINRLSIYNLIIYGIIVLLGLICISCSSKKDDDKQDETVLPSTTSEEHRQRSPQKETKITKQKSDEPKGIPVKSISREGKKQCVTNDNSGRASVIIAELDSAISPERKIELIESLSELSFNKDPSVINVVKKALDDRDPEVWHAAMELLEDYESPEVLPVIEKALKSPDEETREYALRPLSNINDPKVGQLLAQALNDTSEDIRAAAIETAEDCPKYIKLNVMEKAITSPYHDVKDAAVSMLEDRADHKAVDILIMGLRDDDFYSHELINEALDFLIGKEFETYQEAHSWWLANKNNYDDELFEKEDQ